MKKLLLSTLLIANGVVAAPFVVKDIRVDGVQPAVADAIISTLPVKVGQTATDNDVAKVVRQLFVQNRFEDVRASREGNTLVIKISEYPIINSIDISGNSAIPKDPLEQNLRANLISKGELFNAAKLDSFKAALLEHYHSMGRYSAKIDTVIDKAVNGGVNIKLAISEGEVSKVKSISFAGNKAFSDKELLNQLDIQPNVSWWNIFQSSKFQQPTYNQDLETLRDFYMNRGYAKFNFEKTETKFSEDKKEVHLTYHIHEGEQYRVSQMRIIGDTAKEHKELNKLLYSAGVGRLFNKSELSQIEQEIKQVLGDRGFGSAKVDVYPHFNEENKTVRISFVVEAGRRIYVRKINFEGNDVTADSTLRQEMRQPEGTWLSTGLAELGKVRLERTGFFESVEMNMPSVQNSNDQVDLVYKIKERNTGSISFGIGYGSESGLSYQAGIKQDNFLGLGSTISLSGSRNDYGTSVALGYTEPYFTKDGVSLGGNVFYEDYDNSKNDSASNYKRRTYGINGTLGIPFNENNGYYLGLGYTHDTIKNAQREFTREGYVKSMGFPIEENSDFYRKIKANDFDFSFGWNYNTLNRGYFPTKGSAASLGAKVTIPGSDNKYYKVSADFRNYYPLDRQHKWVIGSKANLSYANGFGGKQLPFYQTYSAGGIGSLRGFGYGAVGPKAIYRKDGQFIGIDSDVIGGNAMALASLELIMPTPFISDKYQHQVRTSVFVDMATVWNTKWSEKTVLSHNGTAPLTAKDLGIENFKDYNRFRASAGVSLQWNSPIGPLVFSYAKPIKKYTGDEIEQFQFSIGGSF